MNGKHYIGKRVSSLEFYDDVGPVTGVALLIDDETEIFAGTETGYVIEIECRYGTQAMAENILSSLSGRTYKGFRGTGAGLDPLAELGDGITIGGEYTFLANRVVNFSAGHRSEISAPGENALVHEFGYLSPTQRETRRRDATARSLISKTASEIRMEVSESLNNLSASINLELEKITAEVFNDDGSSRLDMTATSIRQEVSGKINSEQAQTLIDQSLDKIELSVSSANGSSTFTIKAGEVTLDTQTLNLSVAAANISGTLTASQIDATNLKVSAANITGELTIGQLPEDVAVQDDIPYYTSDLYNDSGYQTGTGVVSIINGTVDADFVNALGVSAQYLQGKYIYLLDSSEYASGRIIVSDAETAAYAIDIESYAGLRLLAESGMYFESGYGTFIQMVGSGSILLGNGDIYPSPSNTYSCGIASWYWSDVYAGNATIQTSDRNKKTDIVYGLDNYDALFDALRPVSFLFKDGTSGRRHLGMIAQDVEDSLADLGLSTLDFAGFIKSERTDENGKVIEGEYEYALRYGELIPMCVEQIQRLKKRVAALEGT